MSSEFIKRERDTTYLIFHVAILQVISYHEPLRPLRREGECMWKSARQACEWRLVMWYILQMQLEVLMEMYHSYRKVELGERDSTLVI